MKCDYCETTEDVHTLVDRELGPDLHICRGCWERGEEARLSQSLTLKPVETPYFERMPRKKWDTPVYQFNPIVVGGTMTEQSNICEICGGIKNLVYLVEAVPKDAPPVTLSAPSKPWGHLCYGHPKGAPKHDGKLGDDCDVYLGTLRRYPSGRQEHRPGITISGYDDGICLTPKQAISLLSWLEQNKAELTALAEQERE